MVQVGIVFFTLQKYAKSRIIYFQDVTNTFYFAFLSLFYMQSVSERKILCYIKSILIVVEGAAIEAVGIQTHLGVNEIVHERGHVDELGVTLFRVGKFELYVL